MHHCRQDNWNLFWSLRDAQHRHTPGRLFYLGEPLQRLPNGVESITFYMAKAFNRLPSKWFAVRKERLTTHLNAKRRTLIRLLHSLSRSISLSSSEMVSLFILFFYVNYYTYIYCVCVILKKIVRNFCHFENSTFKDFYKCDFPSNLSTFKESWVARSSIRSRFAVLRSCVPEIALFRIFFLGALLR